MIYVTINDEVWWDRDRRWCGDTQTFIKKETVITRRKCGTNGTVRPQLLRLDSPIPATWSHQPTSDAAGGDDGDGDETEMNRKSRDAGGVG